MALAKSGDVSLYYEEAGKGVPLLFVHEFSNDMRGWEAQVRYFSRCYRCITFNARGYPPSDVPECDESYGHEHAVADIGAILDHLEIDSAFIVGLSMGATGALQFMLANPGRVRGLVFASGGSGSDAASRPTFIAEARDAADVFLENGMGPFVDVMSYGPTRVQLLNKDPRSWAEFRQQLSQHSALGKALTMRNYQARRPSVFEFEAELKQTSTPVLIIAGDEDDPVLDASLFLKRSLSASGLLLIPRTGHAVNLEEPAEFNRAVDSFLSAVRLDNWPARDIRANAGRSAMLADEKTETG
ncbi:alpha/beta fold hydrolase [Mesorhizobium sp. A556]